MRGGPVTPSWCLIDGYRKTSNTQRGMTLNKQPKSNRPKPAVQRVGIIGAGTMGSGIAQVAATAGCRVTVLDVNKGALEKAKVNTEKILARLIEKGRMTREEKDRAQ
ncbi:MAG: 3-hydroxyacyl-CoA dehydrogenase NAD-binding domain-containing protein, partial [Marinirhabdus sp.]